MIGSTNFTIVLWLQTTDTGGTPSWTNGKGLLDGEVLGATNDFGLALVGTKAAFGVGNPDTTLLASKSINDGLWHQIIATRDAGSGAMQIYIDGIADGALSGPTVRGPPRRICAWAACKQAWVSSRATFPRSLSITACSLPMRSPTFTGRPRGFFITSDSPHNESVLTFS